MSFSCPIIPTASDRVLLAHGGGGRLSRALIQNVFRRHFRSPELDRDHDGAYLEIDGQRWAMTTDGYVVSPTFFPGGDIGSLAVHGTVNDLAACGARARWISAGFILEEGFPLADLDRIVRSMAQAAECAQVELVTGDTKVVEHGKGDGIFITTTGLGRVLAEPAPTPGAVRPGDRILISGPIGLHGMAILSVREGLGFEADLTSDSAPLGDLVAAVYESGARPHCLRDPTRGGVGATLAEIAAASGTGILLEEAALPVPELVQGACEILGLDPLLVANEGKMLLLVAPEDQARTLEALRRHPSGREAVVIGRVVAEEAGSVLLHTALGSTYLLDIPAGEALPRIC
ncbi:MAG TPA: hydrogenase expression/formation protein HypE [Isosphaeraceae bacterium]|nr:hydrogenase expression/formation protein HypE [Isosphaeraceae bacterium]